MFVNSFIDGHLGHLCILAIVNDATINMGVQYLLKILILFPLAVYPKVVLLDRMVVLPIRNFHTLFP